MAKRRGRHSKPKGAQQSPNVPKPATAKPTGPVQKASQNKPAAPVLKPWEIDSDYAKPKDKSASGHQRFDYDRPWISLGGEGVNMTLSKELARQQYASLPILVKGLYSKEEKKMITEMYHKAGKSDLFDLRLRNINKLYEPKLIFTSPLTSADQPAASFAAENTESGLLKLMSIDTILDRIIDCFKPDVHSLSRWAATCRQMAVILGQQFETWSFATNSFPTKNFEVKSRFPKHDLVKGWKQSELLQKGNGVRSQVLIVTGADTENKVTQKPHQEDFDALTHFIGAVQMVPLSFRDVIFDRVPYFDHRMLEACIKCMPNLKTIAVHKCLLLDASKLPELITVIRRNPRISKKTGEKSFIKLDFAPYRFNGPQTKDHRGDFVLTYNEPTFHMPKAITSLIMRCRVDAQTIGMDLLSDSSSFWHFLRQVPGPCSLWALKVRDIFMTWERNKNWKQLADDITAATAGDNEAPERIPRSKVKNMNREDIVAGPEPRMAVGYWRKPRICPECHITYPKSLCKNLGPNSNCWGCNWRVLYNEVMESSHFRFWKKSTLDFLFQNVDLSKTGTDVQIISEEDRYEPPDEPEPEWECKDEEFENELEALIRADEFYSSPHYHKPEGDDKLDCFEQTEMRHIFTEQNIQTAFNHSILPSDQAWNYYMDYNPKCGVAYPEPKNANRDAASVRRWIWHYEPLEGPVDFRHGGPQHENPFIKPATGTYIAALMTSNRFQEVWDLTGRIRRILEKDFKKRICKKILCKFCVQDTTTKNCISPDQRIPLSTTYEEWEESWKFRKSLGRVAAKLRQADWERQLELDAETSLYGCARVEDSLYSMNKFAMNLFNNDALKKKANDPNMVWEQYRTQGAPGTW
ncbi:hypothetical protein B0H66DRAFT_12670 [Apodospora peruviana]|uniref:Uncharacterized protein n=1 Tax=Apodospora peruviana TaxID=516989 RepID=A0AAE0IPP4_9PEZI|nr:hypothetical protein B0H66DRAFT_12670 [Apodospora peruviana]